MLAQNDLPSKEVIDSLVSRARSGDTSALPGLRSAMDKLPALRQRLGGNIQSTVEHFICKSLAGPDLAFTEAVRRKMTEMKEQLAGINCSALEELLIDRIVMCWLQVQEAELRLSQNAVDSRADFLTNRLDRAHKRYLSAIKALATVRKLALPTLQVNIAKNQLNVAGA